MERNETGARGTVNARDALDTYAQIKADLAARRPLGDIPRVTPDERAEAVGIAAALEDGHEPIDGSWYTVGIDRR